MQLAIGPCVNRCGRLADARSAQLFSVFAFTSCVSRWPLRPPQKEVLKTRNLQPIDEEVLTRGIWRYCLCVRVKGIIRRSIAFGVVTLVLCGVPAAVVIRLCRSGDDSIHGLSYCIIKSFYGAGIAALVFPGMFFSAISSDKFRGTAYEVSRCGLCLVTASTPGAPRVHSFSCITGPCMLCVPLLLFWLPLHLRCSAS